MDRFDWIEVKDGHNTPPVDVVETDPMSQPFTYARKMRESGHFRSAVAHYEQAIAVDPKNYPAWIELIDTLVRARQIERADLVSAKAHSTYSGVPELYPARALVLLHKKELESAKIELERGYVLGDRSWYLSCVQAEIIVTENPGYSKEALSALEKATIYSGSTWESFFIGGWILLDANQPTWAAGYFAEAGHRNPTAPIVWLCLGDCFKELRLYDQAMFYYQKASELEPTHALALKRQRACARKPFGLLRIFDRDTLQKKWNQEFNKTQNPEKK
jgi:tetratricopeptide (TPR) repeat protein